MDQIREEIHKMTLEKLARLPLKETASKWSGNLSPVFTKSIR